MHIDDIGAYGGVYVADDQAWEKVKARVYKAFSVRFVIEAVDALNKKLVTAFRVIEASLVDIPSDAQCAFAEFRSGDAFSIYRSADFQEENSMSKTAHFASEPAAAAALAPGKVSAFPATDIAHFRNVTQDTLVKVNAGDQSGARARITDLERAWDHDQDRLQAIDSSAWTALDREIDAALKSVRSSSRRSVQRRSRHQPSCGSGATRPSSRRARPTTRRVSASAACHRRGGSP